MATLAHTKTWNKVFTEVLASGGPSPAQSGMSAHDNQARQVLWDLKESLIDATKGTWTVTRSAGNVSGSWTVGNSDNWPTSNAVWFSESGGPYSWCVFQNNAIRSGFQMLITSEAAHNAVEVAYNFYFSPSGGFVGGDQNARPTASDEYMITTDSSSFFNTSNVVKRLNVLMSSDGECTRIITSSNGSLMSYILVDKPKFVLANPPFQGQCITGVLYNTGDLITSIDRVELLIYRNVWNNGQTASWFACHEGVESKGVYNSAWLNRADNDGNYFLPRLHCISDTTNSIGYLGTLQDLYPVSNSISNLNYFPGDGSQEWVTLNSLLSPNDGTNFVV
jgi:hypothetical protein